ncbi:MAG: hypothetical protein LBL80_01515 [Ruminococcus sp.]|nr:hypothetical protein [Ruminococcus sp.]
MLVIKKRLLKAFSVLILALIVLTITGCDKLKNSISGGIPISDTPFSARMEIDTEDIDFVSNVKRLGMGLWEMEVLEPEAIKGLTIVYDGKSVSSTMNGFTQTQPIENVTDSAVFLQIFRTIDNAISTVDPQGKTVDGKYVLDGEIPTSSFEIIFNPETNAPEEIKLPEAAMQAYISEFQILS